MTSSEDLAAMDTSVRPQDDLFGHVNGTWLRTHEIPADRGRDGTFHALADQAEIDVRTIITDADSWDLHDEDAPLAAKIARLYHSYMDEARIEELGLEALRPELDELGAVTTLEEFTELLGKGERFGAPGFFGAYVDNDATDPDSYRLYLAQAGLGLPDESYYRGEDFAEIRSAYLDYLRRMLTLADLGSDSEAEAVLALETELASHHWDNVKDREATLTYNPVTQQELTDLAGGFDWASWARAAQLPSPALDSVVLREPSYFKAFAQIYTDTDLATLKLWFATHLLTSRAGYLSESFSRTRFDFYGTTLSGATQQRDRWKRAVQFVESVVGEGVGKLYVTRHFPPGHKAAMDQLVADLVEAYRRSIGEIDWMSPQTRKRALDKLNSFTPKIGYPDRWRDFGSLEIGDDLMTNVRAAAAFDVDYELGKLGKPVDRDEWFMPPQTVNAYYNPGMNEIVFPAAILQPPFFDADADAATNYAAIGAVIGHEIGHGFDDQGSHYDGRGRLENWWTDADRAAFEQRVNQLIADYDELSPRQLDGSHHVKGALTVGENIGDLGGLSIALKAYRIAAEREGRDVDEIIDGVPGLQRFFLSWARAWRSKGRNEEVIRLLTIDPHSPDEFRTNQVCRYIDEFHTAFGVQPGDAMWLDTDQRVRIW